MKKLILVLVACFGISEFSTANAGCCGSNAASGGLGIFARMRANREARMQARQTVQYVQYVQQPVANSLQVGTCTCPNCGCAVNAPMQQVPMQQAPVIRSNRMEYNCPGGNCPIFCTPTEATERVELPPFMVANK